MGKSQAAQDVQHACWLGLTNAPTYPPIETQEVIEDGGKAHEEDMQLIGE